MSETLGPLTFERERRPLFLETMMPPSAKDYSETTAQQIDLEVSALAVKAYKRAKEILESKLDTLEKVALVLLDKEVLEGEELRRLLNEHPKEG
jgi:cell division protease FtsH